MTTPHNTDLNIAKETVQNHFKTNKETPYESISPMTQTILTNQAYKWLQDAKPALINNGWTPPQNTQHTTENTP